MQLIRQNLVALTVATMCAATASASSSQGSGPAAPSAGKTTRIASGSGEAQLRAFTRNVIAVNAAFNPRLQALEQRGEDIKLGSTLSAASLTTPTGISAGRTAVAQMRAMLAERRETLRQYHQELQRLLTPELQAKLGVGSVAQVQSKHAHAERMAEELDTARTNYVDAVDNVLSWAEQQGDTIKLQEGQILWDSQAQIERYKSLFSKVLAAAADESRLYDEMTPVYQQ